MTLVGVAALSVAVGGGVYFARGRIAGLVVVGLVAAAVAAWIATDTAGAAELAYVEDTTATRGVNGSSGTPTNLIETGSLTFDGSTPVVVEFVAPSASATVNLILDLYEGSTDRGRMYQAATLSAGFTARARFVPTAGSKTISVRGWITGGTTSLSCGGGSPAFRACYLRVTDESASGGATVAWADVTGKPSTFPPDLTSVELGDLVNVNITSPDDGAVLTFDFPTGKWYDGAASGGGGGISCAAEDPCAVYIDPFSVSQVSLSEEDRERSDLGWVGTWAAVGILLALLIALRWYNSWRFLRE